MLGERPHAGEEAWRGLSAQGLPLIEPHPDDDALARVTFIFKTAPSVSGVRLDSVIAAPYARQPVSDYVKDFTLPLQSIGETGIWWITLDVPREIEAVYSAASARIRRRGRLASRPGARPGAAAALAVAPSARAGISRSGEWRPGQTCHCAALPQP
jgi:hypothetical protein